MKTRSTHTPGVSASVCRSSLPPIIPVLTLCPLQCPDCIIAGLPKSPLNGHFLFLRATIKQPFTTPALSAFVSGAPHFPPPTGAPGPSQTLRHNHCQPSCFPHPSFVTLFLVSRFRLRTRRNKALNRFRAAASLSGRCLQLRRY